MRVWFETRQYDNASGIVFTAAAEPADLPLTEVGIDLDWRFQAQELVSRRIRERHSWLGKAASVKATTLLTTK
jgi:hypothetical protein